MYSGANLQAAFGAWCAVLALAEEVGQLTEASTSRVVRVGAEQNWPLDDIALWFESDDRAFAQVKSGLDSSTSASSDFAAVADQIARQYAFGRGRAEGEEPLRDGDRFLIVVADSASSTIRVDLKEALERLASHPPTDDILSAAQGQGRLETQISRLTQHLERSLRQHADAEGRAAIRGILSRTRVICVNREQLRGNATLLLSTRVLEVNSSSQGAFAILEQLFSAAGQHRASYDVATLRQHLVARGCRLKAPPSIAQDVQRIESQTQRTVRRDERLRTPDGPIEIARTSLVEEIIAASRYGNIAVTAEAGGGKSVVLHQVWRALHGRGERVVVIDLVALGDPAALGVALHLTQPFGDVLAQWSSDGNAGYLLLDGLDALRLNFAIHPLVSLVRDLRTQAAPWRVIAASREFDLRTEPTIRALFPRIAEQRIVHEDPDPQMLAVAHVLVGGFDDQELAEIGSASPTLCRVLASADAPLRTLLRNPFNLAIAAELAASDIDFSRVHDRLDLLNQWWARRVATGERWSREDAIGQIAGQMISERRLQVPVRRFSPPPQALPALMSDGVFITAGRAADDVAFRHALLFDYSAYRTRLADTDAMVAVLREDPDVFIFVLPSIRMRLDALWHSGRDGFYSAIAQLFTGTQQRYALLVIICRIMASEVRGVQDLMPLLSRPDLPSHRAVRYVVRSVIRARERGENVIADRSRNAWIDFVAALSDRGDELQHDALLLLTEFTEHDPASRVDGRIVSAAKRCLERELEFPTIRQGYRNMAIDAFLRTYDADPGGGRPLMERLFDRDRLIVTGPYEFNTLGYHLNYVTDVGALALAYDVVFSDIQLPEHQVSMGGGSQIFGFSQDARQALQSARWALAELYPRLVQVSPTAAARALVRALEQHRTFLGGDDRVVTFVIDGAERRFRPDIEEDPSGALHQQADWARMYRAYEEHLIGSLGSGGRTYADAILDEASWGPVPMTLLRMLLRRAGSSPLATSLVPIVVEERALRGHLVADAIAMYLQNSFASLSEEDRAVIETGLSELCREPRDEDHRRFLEARLDLFLTSVPANAVSDLGLRARLRSAPDAIADERERALNLTGFHMGTPTMRTPRLTEGMASRGAASDVLEAIDAAMDLMPTQNQAPPQPELLAPMVRRLRPLLDRERGPVYEDLIDVTVAVIHYALSRELLSLNEQREFVPIAIRSATGMRPEPREVEAGDETAGSSWGWPHARILAAQCLGPLYRSLQDAALLEALERLADDPVPAVRCQALHGAWHVANVDASRGWAILEKGTRDQVLGVARTAVNVSAYLAPLDRVRYGTMELEMHARVVRDYPTSEFAHQLQRNVLYRALLGDAGASEVIAPILETPWSRPDLSRKAALDLTNALAEVDATLRVAARDTLLDLVSRLRSRIEGIGEAAGLAGYERYSIGRLPDESREEGLTAARCLVSVGERLYFDSGAYAAGEGALQGRSGGEWGLSQLHFVAPLIRALAPVPYTTLSYHLLRTLLPAAPIDPATVLDLGAVALRAGIADGLTTEYLAQGEAAQFVLYFVEHERALLIGNRSSLGAIMDVIDAFADAGWPEWIDIAFAIDHVYREE